MNRIISSMIMSMVVLSALSQTKGEKQTLVVGIVIDQLRSDYVELLQTHFGQKGFNRLVRDGAYFENVDFNINNTDAVSASTILFTGTYPRINGIPGAKIFDLQKRIPENIFNDPSKIGNFTSETFSPQRISVSTLADEVKVNSNGLGYVYSIAPDAQQAIAMAGHAANSAFWISDINGFWATSTYYKDIPQTIQTRNYKNPLSARLDTASWVPSLNIDKYPDIPTHRKYYPFRYMFARNDKNRYRAYKQSAIVNEEVTTVAIDYIKSLALGKRNQLDMLNIAYTAAPFDYASDPDNRVELQDTYIKLDSQLARLFDVIDKSVGINNTVIFVSSTGYYNNNQIDDPKFNIPTGEFYPSRAKSLLNMYLMAIYGNGDWVLGYDQNQFFLNRALIKDKNKDITDIRTKSCQFLRQMSGITEAFTLDDIINNPVSEWARSLKNSTVINFAGDVTVEIAPGWQIVDNEQKHSKSDKNNLVRANAINTPAFILAPSVNAQKITSVIDATFLAPTVSRILRIRSPNAASHKPLSL